MRNHFIRTSENDQNHKTVLIKTLHTFIWLCFNVILSYLAYAAVSGRIGYWAYAGVAAVFLEGAVLLACQGKCPLILWAARYGPSTANANFDIFLPGWLARNDQRIYTSLFSLILPGLIWRLLP